MGFTPQQVGAMSLYQWAACVDGWNRAQNPEGAITAPSAQEFEAVKRLHGDG